jgi:hypothetical protein
MNGWLKRRIAADRTDAEPQWTGLALVGAANGVATDDTEAIRTVAFEIARATRRGDDCALQALSALLARALNVSAVDRGTLVNLMSALQYAAMRPEARADWLPPVDTVARAVELGRRADEVLRDQVDGLLWALVDRRLAVDWLGRDRASTVADSVESWELREELLGQVRASEFVSLVEGGEEFPCVPA